MSVTHEEMVARARDMIPLLKARADADERNRKVDPDTIQRMKDAGFFRVLQSRRWGGNELGQDTFAEIQIALAEGDMSVGWVYGILGVHTLHMCHLDDRAARDVWGDDSSVLVASPYLPAGIAKPVPGGYEFSGRWSYSSGCEHCPWTFLGGFVEGDTPDYRYFLLPRADAKILDTWDTLGLAATGSHDVVVEKAFVPEYRTHKAIDAFLGTSPGLAVNTTPLFRMPMMLVFMRCITNAQIGALQALLELAIEYIKPKTMMGRKAVEDPDVQFAIANAKSGIAEMKAVLHANFAVMQDHAERGAELPLETRHMFRYQSAQTAERCIRLAEALIQVVSGGAVFNKGKMARIYRNMLTARQHAAAQYRGFGRIYGELLLGREVQDIHL